MFEYGCRMSWEMLFCLFLQTSRIFPMQWMLLRLLISLACTPSANATGIVSHIPFGYRSPPPALGFPFYLFVSLGTIHHSLNGFWQVYPKHMCHIWGGVVRGLGLAVQQHCQQGLAWHHEDLLHLIISCEFGKRYSVLFLICRALIAGVVMQGFVIWWFWVAKPAE